MKIKKMKIYVSVMMIATLSSIAYGSTLVFNNPGTYVIGTNTLDGSPGEDLISIQADNVTLDLNARHLVGGDHAIVIGSGFQNTVIKNGFISGSGVSAILINDGAGSVKITNMSIAHCPGFALEIAGATGISNVLVENTEITFCALALTASTVISINNADTVVVRDTVINYCGNTSNTVNVIETHTGSSCVVRNVSIDKCTGALLCGVLLDNSSQCFFEQVAMTDNLATETCTGFLLTNSSNSNSLTLCNVIACSSSGSDVIGYDVGGGSSKNIMDQCVVSSLVGKNAFGFYVHGVGTPSNTIKNSINECTSVNSMAFAGNSIGFFISRADQSAINQGFYSNQSAPSGTAVGILFDTVAGGNEWIICGNEIVRNIGSSNANSYGINATGVNNSFCDNVSIDNGDVAGNQMMGVSADSILLPAVDLSTVYTVMSGLDTDLTNCCTTINSEFRQTWTILANLHVTASVDFSGVYTAIAGVDSDLNNCCTTINSKFSQTWTILAAMNQTIVNDFNATWTAIAGVDQNINNKFNQTWTILAELDRDIEGCCTTINNEFQQTWTILAAMNQTIINDFNATWTAIAGVDTDLNNCCTTINSKFNQTWTILAGMNQTIVNDFNGTWTAIAGVDQNINNKFNQTWTILAELDRDIEGCCTTINNEFQQTWTILAAMSQTIVNDFNGTWTILANLHVTTSVDLSGVYTAIAGVDTDLNNCCTTINSKFNQTWTILAAMNQTIVNDFNGTWTILSHLQVTATVDLSGVYTAIAGVDKDLTNCCTTINSEFNQTWTILKALDDQVGEIHGALCNVHLLHQSDVGLTTFTIATPGNYVFAEDIVFSPAIGGQPAIEITTDDVTIDFCDNELTQGNTKANVTGIRVPGGPANAGRENIRIENGSINNFTYAGVVLGTNVITPANTHVEEFLLNNVGFHGNVTRAIDMSATSTVVYVGHGTIENCTFRESCTGVSADFIINCSNCANVNIIGCAMTECGLVSNNLVGINAFNSSECVFDSIDIQDCFVNTFTGILLRMSNINTINNCTFSNNTVTNGCSGFVITGVGTFGNHTTASTCRNNVTTNGPFAGFELLAGLNRNVIEDCLVGTNTVIGSQNCIGFNLDQVNNCTVNNCVARYNSSGGTGAGTNYAAGFNISTSNLADNSTGCKNCEFQNNTAFGNNGIDANHSYGFRVISATVAGNQSNTFIQNFGIRNGSVGVAGPGVGFQIVSNSASDTPNSAGGVPNGSLSDTSISALNAGLRLTNYRIT